MTVFIMTLKRIFGNTLCLIFLALFPVISFILLSATGEPEPIEPEDMSVATIRFGLADDDDTILSRTLADQLALRYNIIEVDSAEISATLIENSDIPWVLLIESGFERDILAGNTNLETLKSHTLAMTDVSAVGSIAAENITRSLMMLGTNDEAVLAQWEQAARIELNFTDIGINLEGLWQWLSMFGFVSILTAYFVIRTLSEDKLKGMPDRIGSLPVAARNYLAQGTLAAFVATQVSVALTVLSLHLVFGEFENSGIIFLMMSMFNLFAVSLVFAIMSLTKTFAGAATAMTMTATLLSMLGGLFWPIEVVPDIMQRIAWFTPGYWYSRGLRYAGEITFEGFAMPILFMLAFTAVTLLVGGLRRVQKMEIE